MCADFTNLNKILRTHKYTLPNVQDFVNLAHGCKYFTTLDIKDAYYSISVRPADKHMLTIATPLGNFQYNFLPMGLATSSCYYQRLMNEVVAGLPNVFAYLDDIIVMSQTKEQHAQLLDKLFECLKVHGLVVNETKCVFCVSSLIFRLVHGNGIPMGITWEMSHGMGWDYTHCISHGTYGTAAM